MIDKRVNGGVVNQHPEPTMNAKLSAAQHFLLAHAAEFHDGKIINFPAGVRGNARQKMLQGLLARDLVRADGPDWFVTDNGYAAIGRETPPPQMTDPGLEAAVAAAEAQWQPDAVATRDAVDSLQKVEATIRPGTKLAAIIDSMRQPGGATIAQMMHCTGWQAHTVRGAISGMVKERHGYQVVAEKGTDRQRTYRIA